MNRYEMATGSELPGYESAEDLMKVVIDYYELALNNKHKACSDGNLPNSHWERRPKEWSFGVSAYEALMFKITKKDYAKPDELASDLSRFRDDLESGLKKTPEKSQAHTYFWVAIAMMDDLLDYVYCSEPQSPY